MAEYDSFAYYHFPHWPLVLILRYRGENSKSVPVSQLGEGEKKEERSYKWRLIGCDAATRRGVWWLIADRRRNWSLSTATAQ